MATHLGEGGDDVEAGHREEGRGFRGAAVIAEGRDPKDGESSGPGMDRQGKHGLDGRIQAGEPKSGMLLRALEEHQGEKRCGSRSK